MTRRLAILLSAVLLVLVSCGPNGAFSSPLPSPPAATTPAPAYPAVLTDFQNRTVTIAAEPKRVVSIGPSNTEFLFALGAGDRVVGRDDFSDEPAAAKQIEAVGGVKVNVEKVILLRPDLVITVKFSDGTIERIAGAGIPVLVVDPQGLDDVARTAILIGHAVARDGEGLAGSIDQKLQAVKARVASAPAPRVFHEVDASDPAKPFTVGTGSYINDLITLVRGVNVAARTGSAYPQMSLEEVVRADPEVIVLGDADYGTTLEQVLARPGWGGISAVKSKRVFPISDSLVSRPGPRVGDAAEAYAKLLHPELYP